MGSLHDATSFPMGLFAEGAHTFTREEELTLREKLKSSEVDEVKQELLDFEVRPATFAPSQTFKYRLLTSYWIPKGQPDNRHEALTKLQGAVKRALDHNGGDERAKFTLTGSLNERALLELPLTVTANGADEVLMHQLQDQLAATFPNMLKDFASSATVTTTGLEVEACESRRVKKRAVGDKKKLRCLPRPPLLK